MIMISHSEFLQAKEIVFKTNKQFVFDMFVKTLKKYKEQIQLENKYKQL